MPDERSPHHHSLEGTPGSAGTGDAWEHHDSGSSGGGVSSGASGEELDEFEAAIAAMDSGDEDVSMRRLTRGEIIKATVIQVDKDRAFVDLGMKSEGVIPLDELAHSKPEDAREVVKVGDEIRVKVMEPRGQEGNPVLSKRLADFDLAWERMERAYERGEVLHGFVTATVKRKRADGGEVNVGLEVDLGVKAFVPASQVSNATRRGLDRFVGRSLALKILSLDREKRRVVASNVEAEKVMAEEKRSKVFSTLRVGDVVEGVVKRLCDYGAFVDVGGVDALLHVSEMDWSRVEHPREALRRGERVKAMVLRIDKEQGRISLGRRQVLPDPWIAIREKYSVGFRFKAVVSRLVASGAFVRLPEGAEAFLPLSQMAHQKVRDPSEVVAPKQEVEVQVITLKPEERRMVVSMRALLPFEERPRKSADTWKTRKVREESLISGFRIGERLTGLQGLLSSTSGAEEEPLSEGEQGESEESP
ncbi:MAG: S1 RNA-binding domain-containing protein [Candidatus Caldarchaeum sp.]